MTSEREYPTETPFQLEELKDDMLCLKLYFEKGEEEQKIIDAMLTLLGQYDYTLWFKHPTGEPLCMVYSVHDKKYHGKYRCFGLRNRCKEDDKPKSYQPQ